MNIPKISLVIPATPGDAAFLPTLLRTFNLGPLLPYEVIISISRANDLDKSLIPEIEEAFGAIERGRILLNKEMLLASGNRNKGADLAKGDVVAFFDADDLPHPRLLEVVAYMFSQFDIMHLNHCGSYEPITNGPLPQIVTADPECLYRLYFSDDIFENCIYRTGAYGFGLPEVFNTVITGHTYVRREVLNEIRFRDPEEKPFNSAEDYIFCMETLFKFKKSMIINTPLSYIRPSTKRGSNPHGYKNCYYEHPTSE